jgi:hypothetical protein
LDDGFIPCDVLLNYFVGNRALIRDVVGRWNEEIKIGAEHWEFFYRCKLNGLRVGYSDKLSIYHDPEKNATQTAFRFDREEEMMQRALKAHNLSYLRRGNRTFYAE